MFSTALKQDSWSGFSRAGPVSDGPALHPCVQPLLPGGLRGGGEGPLCAQHGLLCPRRTRIQDRLS